MDITRIYKYRTVIIGSGCAGLNAADTLWHLGDTDLVLVTENMTSGTSRNTGSDKQTYYKLSLAGDEPDSVGDMAQTLIYPDTHADTALCEAAGSVPAFMKLCALGVPFPQNAYGEYVGYQTDHDVRRRATSAGPLTSRYMTEALERSVRAQGIPILEKFAVRILTNSSGVCALDVFDPQSHILERIQCANIILCTGGPAHIFRDRVYPESQHGSTALALDAGAEGANLHCWQFGLASTGFRWNVSGSYQQAIPRYVSIDPDGCEHEFLADHLGEARAIELTFLKGYQWPYDPEKVPGSSEVDRLVKDETVAGRKVYLDYTRNPRGYHADVLTPEARSYLENCHALDASLPIDRLRAINEPAITLYRDHGIDLTHDLLEIRVCAQHHNGGIAVDANWQSSVPGLYVCGEAAGTFGQKRPGGTALNSTQVGSMRAARHVSRNGRTISEALPVNKPFLVPDAPDAVLKAQYNMTKFAMMDRSAHALASCRCHVQTLLDHMTPVEDIPEDFPEKVLMRDMLITQEAVLTAMITACQESGTPQGVLMTKDGHAWRVPARIADQRDLWFERVWKTYREESACPSSK